MLQEHGCSRFTLALATVLVTSPGLLAGFWPFSCSPAPSLPPQDHPSYGYYPTQWRSWPTGNPVPGFETIMPGPYSPQRNAEPPLAYAPLIPHAMQPATFNLNETTSTPGFDYTTRYGR